MTISDVQKIAALARLELTNDELERYAKEISSILDYIVKLNEVNTDNVPITSQVTGLSNVFREDVIEECVFQGELLAQAPSMADGGVKVRSVF